MTQKNERGSFKKLGTKSRRGKLRFDLYGENGMSKQSGGNRRKVKGGAQSHQQKGKQQGHNTGQKAWKSNMKHIDTQPGTGQVGQHPREGELFGSTPGEVRGHAGGKKGQAKGGKRGTMNSRKAKAKRAGRK